MLHYTIEDGLASNTIYDIYQDPSGMIWIGTDKGISRFNGLKFENFTTADGLSDNECFFFQPDYEGRLWIGTYNGKLCFYKDGVFHNEQNTPWLKLKINASHTSRIDLNLDSSLTLVFNGYQDIINLKNNKISALGNKETRQKYLNTQFFYVEKKESQTYLFTYSDESILIDFKTEKILKRVPAKHHFIFRTKDLGYNYSVNDIGGILTDNPKSLILPNKNLLKNCIVFNIKYRLGNLFIATNKGLLVNDQFSIITATPVNKTFVDSENKIWVGTAKNGLYITYDNYSNTKQIERTNNEQVNFAQKQNNQLIVGTNERNYYTYDLQNNVEKLVFDYSKYNRNKSELNSFQWYKNEDLFSISFTENYKINSFLRPSKMRVNKIKVGNIWGANIIQQNEKYVYLRNRRVIYAAQTKELYSNTDTVKMYTIKADSIGSINYGLGQNTLKEIWFSTVNSMYKIKDTIPIIQPQFKNISFREFIFAKQYLLGITHQNQLVICNNYHQKKINLDTVFGNNCVWDKFYTLNDSTILISTNNFFRIISLKPSENKAIYQLRVIENPFIPYQPDFVYADSNDILFFKKNEIKSFPTSYVLNENPLPTIQFSYLKTGKDKLFVKDSLALQYDQSKNLKVLFTPISFYHQKLSFEYSITKNNEIEKWNSFIGEELNLINIGYGKFTIKVRVKTLSGDYSSPAKFILIVNKPFWATWWFIGFCLLLIIAIAATVARIGIKLKLKKKEGEVRFLRSEYKAMNALMNPHFIFNSLNSVQSLVNNNENNTASRYIRIFSDLIRQNMRNIAQELIPISKELDLVENYLKIEKLRFKDKLNFSIHIDEDVETDLIFVPPLLIQPLVENAIKHGIWPKKTDDGFIKIYLFEKENILHIEISDNGSGFNSNAQSDTMHESYAMSNIYTRIEQLSKIHQTKIECHIAEIKNENGLVLGVKSEIIIHLQQ